MFDLSGQIALVTGGSQGIGRATALALAEAGADVAVMARSLDKCEAVAAEIQALGRRALAVRGDLGNEEEIKAIIEDDSKYTFTVSLNDKFGDYGLISLLIAEQRDNGELFIDTWIMSCRVLKRGVENLVLNQFRFNH